MGNKPSSRRRESQIVRPNLASSVNPSLPPDAINTLANCLNRLPIILDKRVQHEVIRRVELIATEDSPEVLLSKGDDPSGIYVLVSGNVHVVSESQKFTLREIKAGDCFGEVSVLFNMKCTADVTTADRYSLTNYANLCGWKAGLSLEVYGNRLFWLVTFRCGWRNNTKAN